ncbi:MAG: glycosyl transferase [Crocinitomicaceae bacterium]|nr:glycosyl transferase [Crocinitomicaceae bacterium]|tara:strand:- start:1375 stop:2184 length:810 start_codon:yes stop_codon:yes gene_type:complete
MNPENQNSTPLLSIITVVLNGEKTIERCIKSVVDQLEENMEYVIIDGASTDSTLSTIKKFEEPVTRWVSESDNSIAEAFNKGVGLATGQYVLFLNADDWLQDGVLKRFENIASKADIVHGNIKYWSKGTEKLTRIGNHEKLDLEMSINHPATFMRRDLILQEGGFNTERKIALDYDLILKSKSAGASFFHWNETITNMSLDGVSDANWYRSCQETFEVKQAILGGSLKNYIWFFKQTATLFLIKNLEKVGFGPLISNWRSNSSKWKNEV